MTVVPYLSTELTLFSLAVSSIQPEGLKPLPRPRPLPCPRPRPRPLLPSRPWGFWTDGWMEADGMEASFFFLFLLTCGLPLPLLTGAGSIH